MKHFRKLIALFSHQERFRILLLFFAMLFGAILEATGIGLILPLISLMDKQEAINEYPQVIRILANFNITETQEIIIAACFAVLVFYLIKNGFLAVLVSFQFSIIYEKQASLSSRLLSVYMRSPWTFHLQRNTAELLRNITQQVSLLFGNVLNPLMGLMTELLVTLSIVSLLMIAQPVAASIAILFLGSFAFVFYRISHRKSALLGQQQQQYMLNMMKWVNQAFGGLKETKVLGREDFFLQAYSTNVKKYVHAHKYLWILGNLPRLFLETLVVGGLLLVSVTVLIHSKDGSSLLPVLALFAAAAFRLMPSFNRIVVAISTIQYHTSVVEVVHRDMFLPISNGKLKIAHSNPLSFKHCIQLENVNYRYPNTKKNTLSNITLNIPRGASAALVGQSGAGKTTLVDIILGLLQPTGGEVLVDGQNIHNDLQSWQRQIGYIPQAIYLSDDTIRRNVAFGLSDEEIDDGKVWKALKYAQLDNFVSELPEGLDTFVGEHGVRLSGGQRQRIGIARALYHEPEVLVLDEATSSLDIKTEKEITKAIELLQGEKTFIIIAHRPSTIEKCELIYEVKSGRIASKNNVSEKQVEKMMQMA